MLSNIRSMMRNRDTENLPQTVDILRRVSRLGAETLLLLSLTIPVDPSRNIFEQVQEQQGVLRTAVLSYLVGEEPPVRGFTAGDAKRVLAAIDKHEGEFEAFVTGMVYGRIVQSRRAAEQDAGEGE